MKRHRRKTTATKAGAKKARAKKAAPSDNTIKGRLVENIVGRMHRLPDVTVERNVPLPALSDPSRTREIDVLVSGTLAAYPVRIAIECKNWNETIDVEVVDAFVGKLDDVGIPRSYGIIVTVKGFTSGALDRAKFAGIRPLVLTGLTDDRLSEELTDALMSIVYLLPVVTSIQVTNSVGTVGDPSMLFSFYDSAGADAGNILDLVWWQWRDGAIPSIIGKHKVTVPLPTGWHSRYDGRPEVPAYVGAEVLVFGLVVVTEGKAATFKLVNAQTGSVEKMRLEFSFEHAKTPQPLAVAASEEELKEMLNTKQDAFNVAAGRVRLPRIQAGSLYWPVSTRVRQLLDEKLKAMGEGSAADILKLDFADVEGTELATIFEPIWQTPRKP